VSTTTKILVYGGAALAIYFLLFKKSASTSSNPMIDALNAGIAQGQDNANTI